MVDTYLYVKEHILLIPSPFFSLVHYTSVDIARLPLNVNIYHFHHYYSVTITGRL